MFNNKGRFQHLQRENKDKVLNEKTKLYFSNIMAGIDLVKRKSPHADLKLAYQKTLEIASITAFTLVICAAQLGRLFALSAEANSQVDVIIEVADIPVTEQFFRPPPPPRPSVPIPTESEEVPEDITIASTEIDLSNIPAPPPPPTNDEDQFFIAYDEPPEIIGGMRALMKLLKYPRVAQSAGLEGIVFVKVLVGLDGKTEKAEVIKAKPANIGFEESAITALKKIRWEPAKQRDHKIRVWVSIPVQFTLVSS